MALPTEAQHSVGSSHCVVRVRSVIDHVCPRSMCTGGSPTRPPPFLPPPAAAPLSISVILVFCEWRGSGAVRCAVFGDGLLTLSSVAADRPQESSAWPCGCHTPRPAAHQQVVGASRTAAPYRPSIDKLPTPPCRGTEPPHAQTRWICGSQGSFQPLSAAVNLQQRSLYTPDLLCFFGDDF